MTATNWAGNVRFGAAATAAPTSVDEVRQVVPQAAAQGRRVRVVGTGHSFNRLADTEGVLVSARALDSIDVDGPGGPGTVTIGAGVRYGELGAALHRAGRALSNLASLPHITVAGAVSTATHGSGDANGNLATSVLALDLVTADGQLRRVTRGEPEFDGLVVGLGRPGIVVALTLETLPTYDVAVEVFTNLPLAAGLAGFDEIMGSAHSVSWFTRWSDGRVDQVWRKSVVGDDRPTVDLVALGATVADRTLHPVPGVDAASCSPQQGAVGPWHTRLAHFRLEHTPSAGDELQSELFVDRRVAVEAAAVLASLGPKLAGALLVSEVRTVAGDRLWLSPALERDVVGFHFTWRSDWSLVEPALAAVEHALAPFDAVPHWGKLTLQTPDRIRSHHHRFADFVALVDRLDPDGRFANHHTDQLMGRAPVTA